MIDKIYTIETEKFLDMATKIQYLQSTIADFKIFFDSIQSRLDNYMIRIKTIEDFIGQNYQSDFDEIKQRMDNALANSHQYRSNLENRLDVIQQSQEDNESNTLSDVLCEKINELNNKTSWQTNIEGEIKELHRFQDITHEQYQFNIKNKDKKPHICPLCEGKGKIEYLGKLEIVICHSCEGKGIIWG
jgi:hypothetical protein